MNQGTNGGKWWPQTVKDALTHYTETDMEKGHA